MVAKMAAKTVVTRAGMLVAMMAKMKAGKRELKSDVWMAA